MKNYFNLETAIKLALAAAIAYGAAQARLQHVEDQVVNVDTRGTAAFQRYLERSNEQNLQIIDRLGRLDEKVSQAQRLLDEVRRDLRAGKK